MSVFTKRLKEARQLAGMSQEGLGVLAGIDEASASARMNQYERGKHEPDRTMVERLARALNVPMALLYAERDDEAELLLSFHHLKEADKKTALNFLKTLPSHNES